ncbi:hypothetical protein ACRRTK_008742 [Alexandromys fortis]
MQTTRDLMCNAQVTQPTGPVGEEPLKSLCLRSSPEVWAHIGHIEGSEEACSCPAVLKLAIAGNRVASDSQEASGPPDPLCGAQDSSVGNRDLEKAIQLWTVLSGFTIPVQSPWVSDIIRVPQCSHLGVLERQSHHGPAASAPSQCFTHILVPSWEHYRTGTHEEKKSQRFLKNRLKDMEAASCTDTQEEIVAILKNCNALVMKFA